MGNTSETRTFDQILSTTYDYYRPVLVDVIHKGNAFYYKLYERGREYQDGGASLIFPLLYGKNQTIGSYEDDEEIDVTVQEGITVAKMPWCQVAGSISFTRKQRRMNSGKAQIINLIQAKIRQAEMSMTDAFNTYLMGTGKYSESATSKDPCGLQAIVPESPSSYNLGGITVSSNTWWRNKVLGNSGTTFTWIDTDSAMATGPVAMRKIYMAASKGVGGSPDFIFAGMYGYLMYESYMGTKMIYRDPRMAEMGFDNIKFRGATMFWDEDVASASVSKDTAQSSGTVMYFLNTEFMHLKVDSQTDFIRTEFQRPVNQDSEAALILWMGNLCTSNRSKHGILVDANVTAIL